MSTEAVSTLDNSMCGVEGRMNRTLPVGSDQQPREILAQFSYGALAVGTNKDALFGKAGLPTSTRWCDI